MTLFDVEELCGYWADHPPLHVTAAALVGRRRQGVRPPPECRTIESVAAELGPGFAIGTVDGGLPPVILDFEQLRITAATRSQSG
jgi:hypothetical protein